DAAALLVWRLVAADGDDRARPADERLDPPLRLLERPTFRGMDCAIRVRNLHKWFGDQHVLRGVDLDVERGRINVIMGGSGQGKTLLLKHLVGLVRPDAGNIFLDDDDLAAIDDEERLARVRRKLGMVFQHAALFDSLTVYHNVAFPLLERYHLTSGEIA